MCVIDAGRGAAATVLVVNLVAVLPAAAPVWFLGCDNLLDLTSNQARPWTGRHEDVEN